MDFFTAECQQTNTGLYILPAFNSRRMRDFMIRGKSFYAVYLEEIGLWSRQEADVYNIVDDALAQKKAEVEATGPVVKKVYWMNRYHMKDSNASSSYSTWVKGMYDNFVSLDQKVTFLTQQTTRKDYASKRLPYDLDDGIPEAYNELMGTLYDTKERRKLEWATGAVLNGDARQIQKMLVLYGPPGSGKSTFLHILEQLMEGYWTTFDARSLTNGKNEFATHFFKDNPLVAIQHDGILSKIEDNSLLNSIVSHEDIVVNEKHKPQYTDRANCMLFLGTNSPVKISDSKSGLIRRVIDVSPSGNKVDGHRYFDLMDRIPFELGKIANHCVKVYRRFGKRYYDHYRPLQMMYATDVFFNFIADNRLMLEQEDPIDLERIYAIYKDYCEKTNATFISQRYRFRDELESYYDRYDKKLKEFFGFKTFLLDDDEEDVENSERDENARWIVLDARESLLDKELADFPAQYANSNETPFSKWDNVKTALKDLNTSKLHYVKAPETHIVIDFDLKNDKGEKDPVLNLDAANKFPPTYAEYSKGGAGIHLHYNYSGDINTLQRVYDDAGIEVKIFNGNSSLRRKLTFCNTLPIATITSGLPLKEERKVVNYDVIKDEQHLRNLIKKNLRKEIHAYTKPSIDYIYKLLNDAYNSKMSYDVRDMRQAVLTFAMGSSNQKDACVKLVNEMKWCSEETSENKEEYEDDRLAFFDCEVFPNLFVVCWKYQGTPDCVRMINPTPNDIGGLMKLKLIGFNNRRYDNHILYARYIGYTNDQLYKLSSKIVGDDDKRSSALFREAYNVSYTDIWDFASAGNKKSLKKWEIELGIHHQENEFPWDQPIPEDKWEEVCDYCCNDVIATEKVFEHLHGDWLARQMLAKLAGGTVNDTTNQLTTKFIFGNDRNPQLVYTDLKTGKRSDGTQDPIFFPDYDYVDGKNMFRGENVSRGGYVWARPGMYENVYTFDVAGMHPASIIAMNYFGKYTPRFKEMVAARTHIKHKELDIVAEMLNGALAEYMTNPDDAKGVSAALKTGNNSCYGLSSASFPNAMRHPDNKNNIIALRGALMMATLRDELVSMGVEVIHIKTDSIKVVNPSKETIDYIYTFGKKYGYDFEVEHHFERICLVNNAVYIAKLADDDPEDPGKWTATGAQFAHPYIFKTLFFKEPLEFKDLCEVKEVNSKSAIYLDMNTGLPEGEHDYQFIGRIGLFCPVKESCSGGELLVKRDDKYDAVSGTKGYRWLEAEQIKTMNRTDDVDMTYFYTLADKARETIGEFGDFEWFVDV